MGSEEQGIDRWMEELLLSYCRCCSGRVATERSAVQRMDGIAMDERVSVSETRLAGQRARRPRRPRRLRPMQRTAS